MSSPKNDSKSPDNLSAQKKAAVLGSQGSSKKPLILTALAAVAIAIVVALIFQSSGSDTRPVAGAQAAAVGSSATEVTHDLALFDDGKARHFDYTTPKGDTIRYFVVKSSDGVIRAAFDACDVCYKARKGYIQDGDEMICVNCGRRFASTKINEVKGGCNPAPLKRTVADGKVIIAKADIMAGIGYFVF